MTIHQATPQDITPLALLFDEYRVFYQYPAASYFSLTGCRVGIPLFL
jgi:hypothetical protein